MAEVIGLLEPPVAARMRVLADRVAAMLVGLIRREASRAETEPTR